MEIQKSTQEKGKKVWNIARIVLHMLQKRGKTAGDAITNLLKLRHHHHRHHRCYYAALTCRPDDISKSYVSPREYEFSCSNTPIFHYSKRRNHQADHQDQLKVMHRVFDMLSRFEASPLPAFGGSPAVRAAAESPLPVKEATEEHHRYQVDKDAEEFIKKFYKDLKRQKRIAAFESPSPYHQSPLN